jgi:hypothetical protein
MIRSLNAAHPRAAKNEPHFSGDFLERYLRAVFENYNSPQEKAAAFSSEPRNSYERFHIHALNLYSIWAFSRPH